MTQNTAPYVPRVIADCAGCGKAIDSNAEDYGIVAASDGERYHPACRRAKARAKAKAKASQ